MFGSIGFTELILILFIVLIIFGAGKLPQLGEGLGKAIKGFKKSVHEADAIEAEAQASQVSTEGVPQGQPMQVTGQGTITPPPAQQMAAPEPSVAAVPPTSKA
ncbi:MAG: twin-arginine translocase TatA/TatE family subunit [Nitrospiraceae bacterium]